MQALRAFSLFKSKSTTSTTGTSSTPSPQIIENYGAQRTYDEIVRNIDAYQANIKNKTQHGYGLAKSLADQVDQDKYKKIQRYEIFINKMHQLYKSEMRQQAKQRKKLQGQRHSILYSLVPLKETLKNYNDMTTRGFNAEATAETLANMNRILRARGYRARVMGDYSTSELDQSWRMQKLVDDITYGLRPDQFYNPELLAKTSLNLGDLGYKNTDLLPQFFNKLNSMIDERNNGKPEPAGLNFQDAVYGGFKNFVARHYVFRGFENNQEFNEYMKILLEWETNQEASKSQVPAEENAAEIERAMHDLVNAAVQVKELQKDFQASIENVRQQYFMMLEATDKHQFIQENQYIYYDMLELQEKLVQGGYLNPDEANQHLANEPFNQRMNRAADVFYDYVLNYAPELLSPQHNKFYEAALKSLPKKQGADKNYLKEDQTIISLSTLSKTLVGLSEQALSFRRDTNKKDYLHKFYEQYLMPWENAPYDVKPSGYEKAKSDHVLMDRSYLKSWKIFSEESQRLLPKFKQMVNEDKNSLVGQINALNALGACRFDEPELRTEIVNNALEAFKKRGQEIGAENIVFGLKGLALGSTVDNKVQELGKLLASRLDAHTLTFNQQVEALWSLCNLQLYETKVLQQLVKIINGLNFERVDHDLKYDEYLKLLDVLNALKFEGPKSTQITNRGLLVGLNGTDLFQTIRFPEAQAAYDPFKSRVVQGLAKGLTDASIEHQVILESELLQNQVLDTEVLNREKYPYKPDVLMGYQGNKIGVFVLPETDSNRDTHSATGSQRFRMRVLESANPGLKTAVVTVNEVVNYDIENLKLDVIKEFNFQKRLEGQLQLIQGVKQIVIDTSHLSDFGLKLTQEHSQLVGSITNQRDVQKISALLQKIYQILVLKNQNELRFEESQRSAGYDEFKFQLMQAELLYNSISKESKQRLDELNNSLQREASIKDMIYKIRDSIPEQSKSEKASPVEIDNSWLGTRLQVELPVNKRSNLAKSIVPELINQRFMWVDDYFHYDDWKTKQQQVYDNFNLVIVPSPEEAPKYFYNKEHHNRRIPQGIFPYPNHKRQLMIPASGISEANRLMQNKDHDDLVLFEKEPYKMMVLKELQKSETLAPIDADTSMITNLQNIKQGLKSDYSDREILNHIFLNLNFTDQLIEEHLGLKKSQQNQNNTAKTSKFVPRNSSTFRRFVESTYFSKDREDPFTHFFLKESGKREKLFKMVKEEDQIQAQVYEGTKNLDELDEGIQRREVLQEKIENALLQMEIENEDMNQLSPTLKSRMNIKYDVKSLVKSEYVYDVDPDLIDRELTDDEYLHLYRRRAESKLIKSKILYKLYQANKELSSNEKLYLKKWVADIKNNKQRDLFNLRDSLMPENVTSLTIGDIEAKNLYSLNTISRVEFNRDSHGQYSLSDLIVELSHFIDEEVVNKVEVEMFSDKMKKEWKLSKDFKAIETRNKEIGIVLNELEEVAWRSAGMINDQDFDYIKRMISIKRNKDFFDKQFYDLDMQSFKNFVDAVNTYDNRIALIERWMVRKEDEFKERVNMPPAQFKKTDQELYALYDAPLKRARESLVAKLLIADDHGNPIQKEYKDLTSKELHKLTENLSLRIYLFNYEYPRFLPQAIKAIMEHPNLLRSDKDQLELYCRMFELDWKGDQQLENRQEFLFSNPIYLDGENIKAYGQITDDVVKEKLQRACAPYVEELTAKILSQGS